MILLKKFCEHATKLLQIFTKLEKTRDLSESQKDNNSLHKLKADCSTRWGSSYDMISRIAEQQKAFCVVLTSDRKYISLLSLLDFELIDSMISVLKSLRELTDTYSSCREKGEYFISETFLLNTFVIKCWLPMMKIQTLLKI